MVSLRYEWMISFERKHYGPYNAQKEVIALVVDAAHDSGKKGYNAQVFVQGVDSQFRTEWIYRYAPYPPKS